jgi:hypothetical protein
MFMGEKKGIPEPNLTYASDSWFISFKKLSESERPLLVICVGYSYQIPKDRSDRKWRYNILNNMYDEAGYY